MILNVGFDGDHVTIECNSAAAAGRLSTVFEHALADSANHSVATITIAENDRGYLVKSSADDVFVSHGEAALVRDIKWLVHRMFMSARSDLLWLHGAAIDNGRGALLISGMAAQGKSTIAGHLLDRGWHLLSDDIAPVHPETREVLPYYEMPVKRSRQTSVLATDDALALEVADYPVEESQIKKTPALLKLLAFVNFAPGVNKVVTKLDAATSSLQILRNTANFGSGESSFGNTSGMVFGRAANLASSTPAFSLSYSDSLAASKVLEELYSSS